ncbi:MAG: mRNA interferase MazF [Actinomycetota bacterium]|nr:mRNA interferase MazF [Actinomycetota bacterium]
MTSMALLRGRVYAAELGDYGEKYYLVVSNNNRNRALGTVLAVRLTTSAKPPIPSIVELGPSEVFEGRVVCDDIVEIWADEVTRDLGALSPQAMTEVGRGLAAALGLSA